MKTRYRNILDIGNELHPQEQAQTSRQGSADRHWSLATWHIAKPRQAYAPGSPHNAPQRDQEIAQTIWDGVATRAVAVTAAITAAEDKPIGRPPRLAAPSSPA